MPAASLPTGARLRLGSDAIVEVTGLRNPCSQLDRFQPGLMAAVLARDEQGRLVRKAGVMGVVVAGGATIGRGRDPRLPLRRGLGEGGGARGGGDGVLGGVVAIEGHLRHAGALHHLVDADGAHAAAREQLVGAMVDPLPRRHRRRVRLVRPTTVILRHRITPPPALVRGRTGSSARGASGARRILRIAA